MDLIMAGFFHIFKVTLEEFKFLVVLCGIITPLQKIVCLEHNIFSTYVSADAENLQLCLR